MKTVIDTHISKYDFNDMVDIIKKQEINISKSSNQDTIQAFSCRLKANEQSSSSSTTTSDSSKVYHVPNFPHYIYSALEGQLKSDLLD